MVCPIGRGNPTCVWCPHPDPPLLYSSEAAHRLFPASRQPPVPPPTFQYGDDAAPCWACGRTWASHRPPHGPGSVYRTALILHRRLPWEVVVQILDAPEFWICEAVGSFRRSAEWQRGRTGLRRICQAFTTGPVAAPLAVRGVAVRIRVAARSQTYSPGRPVAIRRFPRLHRAYRLQVKVGRQQRLAPESFLMPVGTEEDECIGEIAVDERLSDGRLLQGDRVEVLIEPTKGAYVIIGQSLRVMYALR